MIKCIAIDMDGTLLTATQKITTENIEAIKKARERGVEVVIATGRSYQEARFVLKEAGLECPIICVNGAEIRSLEGNVLSSNPLDKSATNRLVEILEKSGVYFEIYTNNGTYTIDEDKGISIIVDIFMSANPDADFAEVSKAAEERFHKGLVKTVNDYHSLFEGDDHEVYKLLAFSFDEIKLQQAKEMLRQFGGVAVSSSGVENIEITSLQAQKGVALESFVKERGIALKDTMAIGDNYNDVSMFKIVGRSVAMGNADEEIKSICHHVTLTNEESGVAKAILEAI